jgi:hypothetical protein
MLSINGSRTITEKPRDKLIVNSRSNGKDQFPRQLSISNAAIGRLSTKRDRLKSNKTNSTGRPRNANFEAAIRRLTEVPLLDCQTGKIVDPG